MLGKPALVKLGIACGKWKKYLSLLAPVILLSGLSIAFAGASPSGSDCASTSDCFEDADCCAGGSGSADKIACGELVQLMENGTCYPLWVPFTIKSGQTDLRCGYKVSWYYKWLATFFTNYSPLTPPKLNIDVVAGRTGARKVNNSDTAAGINWVGSYNVEKGAVGGKDPVIGTITVRASLTMDKVSVARAVDVHLTLIYYKLK